MKKSERKLLLQWHCAYINEKNLNKNNFKTILFFSIKFCEFVILEWIKYLKI